MRSLLLFLGILLFSNIALAEEQSYVTKLTDSTFEDFISKHPITFVKFYAEWCGHCKAFKTEFERAGKIAKEKNLNYEMVEVDAEKETKLAKQYGISGYPTLMLFYNGQQIDYPDDRTAEAVLSFIGKKAAPQVQELKSKKDVEEKMAEDDVLHCIMVSDDLSDIDAYKNNAQAFPEYKFYYTSYAIGKTAIPEVLLKGPNVTAIILYKPYDERQATYYPNLHTTYQAFLETHALPIVGPLNKKSQSKMFDPQGKYTAVLFRSSISAAHSKYEELIKKIGESRPHNVMFLLADPDDEVGEQVANDFGVDKNALPALIIVKMKEDLYRYRYKSTEFTEESILKFIKDVVSESGAIERDLKSEEEPTENHGPVFKVVGKTFEKEVISNDDDVLVKFYAPWCGHCQHLAPIYTELAEKLKEVKGIKIAEIDSTKNDVVGQQINGFPTMKLFVSGKKDQPLEYSGERTVSDMMKFLKANAKSMKEESGEKVEEVKKEEEPKKEEEAKKDDDSKEAPADHGDVFQVTDSNFENEVMKSEEDVLVKFYAPWCGHCQHLAPTYKELATKLKSAKGIKIAEVDATKYKINGQEVNGYPTIKLFPSGKKESPVEYDGDRSLDDFMKFLKTNCKKFKDGASAPVEEKKPAEEPPKKAEEPTAHATEGTAAGTVIKANVKTFDKLVISNDDDVLVKFFAPWCGHCQHMAPAYKELAARLATTPGVKIVEVDSTADKIPGLEIDGFPTIKLFMSGKKSTPLEYDGDRSVDDMMKFLKEHCKNLKEEAKKDNLKKDLQS